MRCFWALYIRIVLRRLAAIEHAIVAHDANPPEPCFGRQLHRVLEGLRILLRPPDHQKDQITRCQNRIEDVPGGHPAGRGVEAKVLGTVNSVGRFTPFRRLPGIDQSYRRSFPDFGLVEPLLFERVSFRDTGIMRDLTDAQMVVEQDFGASLLLRHVMPHRRTPADHGFFVTPTGQREKPSLARQALITNVVNKAVDPLQLGPQHLGVAEIGVPLVRLWMHLEDH
jgi:hypothetical protein